jgi:tetratricopeptide (TPR) repeat protein
MQRIDFHGSKLTGLAALLLVGGVLLACVVPAALDRYESEQSLSVWSSGYAAHQRGDFVTAERLWRAAVEADVPLSATSFQVGSGLWLAKVLDDQERFSEAADVAHKIALMAAARHTPDVWAVSEALRLEGLAFSDLGELKKAEAAERVCLAIRRQEPAVKDELLIALLNLSINYAKQNRYDDSLRLSIEADKIAPGNSKVLQAKGSALKGLRRFKDAERCLLQSLQIYRKAVGTENHRTADVLNSLGCLYDDMARDAESERAHKDALAIRERLFGRDSALVANSLHNLAFLYGRMKRFDEAKKYSEEAVAIARRQLGEDHPETKTMKRILNRIDEELQ